MPEYRIVLAAPPGQTPPPVYLEADSDAGAMEQVVARWTREEVLAVHRMGANRWSIWRVWVRS